MKSQVRARESDPVEAVPLLRVGRQKMVAGRRSFTRSEQWRWTVLPNAVYRPRSGVEVGRRACPRAPCTTRASGRRAVRRRRREGRGPPMNSRMSAAVRRRPRVSSLSRSYGFSMPVTPATEAARMADWTGSPRTSQFSSSSRASSASSTDSARRPRATLSMASSECPNAGPMLRCVVESVRSRCSRLVTRVLARVSSRAHESSRLASAFSNRIGLTLCGIVERARRARHRDLDEDPARDVRPHVGGQVVQHPVEPRDVRVQLGLPVVRLDLRGQRVPRQAEVLDERLADTPASPPPAPRRRARRTCRSRR